VKPGVTLLTDGHASYPGLSGYRTIRALSTSWPVMSFYLGVIRFSRSSSDGLSAHIMAYAANTLTRISMNSCFATIVASIAMSFEALLGLATHHEPTGYWDIIEAD
jgi:hypothetical protein